MKKRKEEKHSRAAYVYIVVALETKPVASFHTLAFA